jgi:hypothetical protein
MINTKTYNTKVINPKSLLIQSTLPIEKNYINKYNIDKIKIDDKSIKLGDKVKVCFSLKGRHYNTYYVVNYMYKEDSNTIKVNEFENNISTTYLLPLLEINSNYLLINENFIGAYVKHHEHNYKLGNYLYIIYRFMPFEYYSKFANIMSNRENCLLYKKDKDKRFDIFIFELDKKYHKDSNLILDGKFSKISEDSKDRILHFHNQVNEESPLHQILYRGKLRRNELMEILDMDIPEDYELTEKPNIINETWNYSK